MEQREQDGVTRRTERAEAAEVHRKVSGQEGREQDSPGSAVEATETQPTTGSSEGRH